MRKGCAKQAKKGEKQRVARVLQKWGIPPNTTMANPFKYDVFRGLCVFVSLGIASVFAQNQSTQQQPPSRDRGDRGDRRGFNPEEMRNRMLAGLREQFEITSDDEWNIIAERIAKVMELRRSTMMGGMGMRGFGGPDRSSRSSGSSANPEVDGLRSAVQAKATDAELKARLTRLRELRKENEQRVEKAQEELRAVLTVRQEAILVMFGLLP